jgi:hypothetical protein
LTLIPICFDLPLSCGATYGSEDLLQTLATLLRRNKSVAHQALFSEKEPKMPENMIDFKIIPIEMKTICNAVQNHLY